MVGFVQRSLGLDEPSDLHLVGTDNGNELLMTQESAGGVHAGWPDLVVLAVLALFALHAPVVE